MSEKVQASGVNEDNGFVLLYDAMRSFISSGLQSDMVVGFLQMLRSGVCAGNRRHETNQR
jgi:hypothetical protein